MSYTYFGYPLILFILGLLMDRGDSNAAAPRFPKVTLVISMHNEERILSQKLENLRDIEYPADRLEILIGSDGSNDQTADLLKRADLGNLSVCVYTERRGKASVLNDLLKIAKGEIVVFSDANTMTRPETIGLLVKPFADEEVGAVSGELLLDGQSNIGESLYWRYETFIKRQESQVKTLLGATGGIYAIRRILYKPLPIDRSFADDFVTPMAVVEQGYRVVYEPGAIAVEAGEASVRGEFQRKVRIGAQNFNAVPMFLPLLSPAAGFVAFAFWSHKIIRWSVPFLLLALAGSTVILEPRGGLYQWSFIAEVVFVLAAGLGAVAESFKLRNPLVALPYYFIAMNAALLVGFFRSILGIQRATWDVQR